MIRPRTHMNRQISQRSKIRCPRSERLCKHAIFENIKLQFCYFFVSFFTFSKVKKFHVCERSHWLRWRNVFREYLRENENVRETVFACSYRAQVESFKQKKGQKSRDTVPLIMTTCGNNGLSVIWLLFTIFLEYTVVIWIDVLQSG